MMVLIGALLLVGGVEDDLVAEVGCHRARYVHHLVVRHLVVIGGGGNMVLILMIVIWFLDVVARTAAQSLLCQMLGLLLRL